MSTENQVNLELDEYRRIGIKDVICMLKSLRSEAVIQIVQSSEESVNASELDINNKNCIKAQNSISCQYSFKNSSAVKGNTKIPQIRELNEIATLLRSMNMRR